MAFSRGHFGLDGSVVPGWPVQLKRAGSEFWHGTVGPDGTVFVDAYEPEPKVRRTDECFEPASLTTLAIRPDGTVRCRVTLIDPSRTALTRHNPSRARYRPRDKR